MADENPPANNPPPPPVPTPAPAAAPQAEPPPAAVIVQKSPKETELEQKLLDEQAARLEAERKASEAEDALQQVVEIDRRRPRPQAVKKKRVTFFG